MSAILWLGSPKASGVAGFTLLRLAGGGALRAEAGTTVVGDDRGSPADDESAGAAPLGSSAIDERGADCPAGGNDSHTSTTAHAE